MTATHKTIKYKKIYAELKEQIVSSKIEKLSASKIITDYSVSYTTAYRILELLQKNGFVKKINGKGTFPLQQCNKTFKVLNIILNRDFFDHLISNDKKDTVTTILDGIFANQLTKSNIVKLFIINPGDSYEEKKQKILNAGSNNGFILLAAEGAEDIIKILIEELLPYMVCSIPGAKFNHVTQDYYNNSFKAVSYLINQSERKRILFLSHGHNKTYIYQRYKAYIDALRKYKIPFNPEFVFDLDPSNKFDLKELKKILKSEKKIDGIFSANYSTGIIALDILKKNGILIPDEVAIIVYGDGSELANHSPSISAINMPLRQIGNILVEKVFEMIELGCSDGQKIILNSELIIREST